MSVLDTFYILFKTNSDEVKKGVGEADQATTKFDEHMGRTDEHVHAAGERIVETFKEIGAAIAAAFAAEKVIELIHSTIELNAKLSETSERLGVSVEDLGALEAVAKRFGGSAEGAVGSLDFLNRGMADIATKGTSRLLPFFNELGIRVRDSTGAIKSSLTVYHELADALQKKSVQERAGLGEKFGIDNGLLLAMSEGSKGFDELLKHEKALGVTNEAQAKAAHEFELKMADLKQVLGYVATVISTDILPALTWVLEKFFELREFLAQHEGFLTEIFIAAATVITAIYIPAMIAAREATVAFIKRMALAAWPVTLVIAAIAALALVIDDVNNYLHGNKSVLGELEKKYPETAAAIKEFVQGAIEAFNFLRDVGEAFGEWAKAAAGWIGSFFEQTAGNAATQYERIANVVDMLWQKLKVIFPELGELAHNFGDGMSQVANIIGTAWQKLAAIFEHIGAAIKAAVAGLPEWLHNGAVSINASSGAAAANGVFPAAQSQLALADHSPLNAMSSNSITNNAIATHAENADNRTTTNGGDRSVTIQKVEVTAPPGSNPDQFADAFGEALKPHLANAINQMDDGVQN